MTKTLGLAVVKSLRGFNDPNRIQAANFSDESVILSRQLCFVSIANNQFCKLWNHDLIKDFNHFGTIDVVALKHNVQWQSHCSNHCSKFNKVSVFVLTDSSGEEKDLPNGPKQKHLGKEIVSKSVFPW